MKTRALLVLLLMLPAAAWTQEVADSVLIFGNVGNYHSGEPMAHCRVLLLQNDDTVAATVTDHEGLFALPLLPAGNYTLNVAREFSLYKADLMLVDNISLTIMVDTMQRITLPQVNIEEEKHLLAGQGLLITNYNDPRLWNMSGELWLSGPAAMDPPDGPFSGKASIGRTFKLAKQWRDLNKGGVGVRTPWDLMYPDIAHPAPADSTAATSQK